MSVSFTSAGESLNAVVFLHGVGSGKDGWDNQTKAVVDAGWRSIAIDAPGFGTTPLPTQAGFKPHVDAIIAVLDQQELQKIVLCGHSLGGMTAQEFYAEHPERVTALVLSATSPAFGKPGGDFQKEFLRTRLEPFENGMTMPEFAREFSGNLLGPSPDQRALDQIIDTMSNVSIEAYRLAMHTLAAFDQRDNLPNISVPTLLISGEHDKNAPAKMMAKMADHIDGAQYVELAATGHMAPIENAAQFNHHLTRFLKSIGNA